jgi:hypothetical protein
MHTFLINFSFVILIIIVTWISGLLLKYVMNAMTNRVIDCSNLAYCLEFTLQFVIRFWEENKKERNIKNHMLFILQATCISSNNNMQCLYVFRLLTCPSYTSFLSLVDTFNLRTLIVIDDTYSTKSYYLITSITKHF